MASLPVVAIDVDYEEELDRIKGFLANGKGVGVGIEAGEENNDDDDDNDAVLDAYMDELEVGNGRAAGRTGLKYRDALVGR